MRAAYFVRADIGDVRGILCARPYPRPDHLDGHGYAESERDLAESFAAGMAVKFPKNSYYVEVTPIVGLPTEPQARDMVRRIHEAQASGDSDRATRIANFYD